MGVKFLLGTGLRALGVGPQAVPERAAERAAPVETAATAKTPREFVERSLAENRAIVFSKSYCGYR